MKQAVNSRVALWTVLGLGLALLAAASAQALPYELSILAREGEPLGDGTLLRHVFPGDIHSSDTHFLGLSESGTVAFFGRVGDVGGPEAVVTQHGVVVAAGDTLPDGTVVGEVTPGLGLGLNDSGTVAFCLQRDHHLGPRAVATQHGAHVTDGDTLPDGTVVRYVGYGPGTVAIDNSGLVTCAGETGDPTGPTAILDRNGVVVAEGDTLPDGSVVTYIHVGHFLNLAVNNMGTRAFVGAVEDPAGSTIALLTEDGCVVAWGDTLGDGTVVAGGFLQSGQVALSDTGVLAFVGQRDDPSRTVCVMTPDGVVVAEGDTLPDGTTVFMIHEHGQEVDINSEGTIVFLGRATSVGSTDLLMTADGVVAGPGDPVGGGLAISHLWDGGVAINDGGEIAFFAHLDDHTDAVILARPVQDIIPEPATLGLLALGALALVRRRRRT